MYSLTRYEYINTRTDGHGQENLIRLGYLGPTRRRTATTSSAVCSTDRSRSRSAGPFEDLGQAGALLVGELLGEDDLELHLQVAARAFLLGDRHAFAGDHLLVPGADDLVVERAAHLLAAQEPERAGPARERAHQRHLRLEHQVVAHPLERRVLLLRHREDGVGGEAPGPLVTHAFEHDLLPFLPPWLHQHHLRHLLLDD